MHAGAWSPAYWTIMLLMWWVMMVAMMTPSAAPMILLYARATRHALAGGQMQPGIASTAAFAGGYLLVWLAFSIVATVLDVDAGESRGPCRLRAWRRPAHGSRVPCSSQPASTSSRR